MSWFGMFGGATEKERIEPALIEAHAVSSSELLRGDALVFGGGVRAAGMHVSPSTAMTSAAVFRCVSLIAGAVSIMPLRIYRSVGGAREEADGHPLAATLQRDCGGRTALTAPHQIESSVADVLLHGNGYWAIERPSAFSPDVAGLTYLSPARTSVERRGGRLIYRSTTADDEVIVRDQDDVVHLPGMGWDGRKALSWISNHARTIGVDLAAIEHTSRFFENGTMVDGYYKFPQKLTEDQVGRFKDYVQRRHGGVENAFNPMILTEGGEWVARGMTARDAQLIELLRLSASQIAMIYGVPPHLIGLTEKSTSWGTGIEQQGIGFVVYTMRPHLRRFEAEIGRKLFPRGEFFVEFDTEALLRGDAKAEAEAHRIALGGNQQPGWLTINEVRARRRLPPIAGGDQLYRPLTGEPDASVAEPSGEEPERAGDDADDARERTYDPA